MSDDAVTTYIHWERECLLQTRRAMSLCQVQRREDKECRDSKDFEELAEQREYFR